MSTWRRTGTVWIAVIALASFGCANAGGGGASSSEAAPAKAAAAPEAPAIPAGHPFAKIEKGMSDQQVVAILGSPDHQNAYLTGKAFIPFYYAGDTSRTDFFYKGKGRVVFSRNQWNGRLKVINVLYDPNEMK